MTRRTGSWALGGGLAFLAVCCALGTATVLGGLAGLTVFVGSAGGHAPAIAAAVAATGIVVAGALILRRRRGAPSCSPPDPGNPGRATRG